MLIINYQDYAEIENTINNIGEDNFRIDIENSLGFYIVLEKFRNKFMLYDDVINIYIEYNKRYFDGITIPLELLEYYLNLLRGINCENQLVHIFILMKNQLKIGDKIKFPSGRNAIIIPFDEKLNSCQIYYKLLKKDGSLGIKEMTLYARTDNYKYDTEREYIDYKKI